MPIYCYTTKDGETREEQFRMGKAPTTVRFPDGRVGRRDLVAEHRGFRHTPGNWPQVSYSLSVKPWQREEATKKLTALGVPTEFNAQGLPVFRSKGHRNAHLRARGAADMDACYGDATPSQG
jgi:hypothetical protein